MGAFYSVDADGNLNLVKQYDNFRKTWDIAAFGGFVSGGFFLYDRAAGVGSFYSVDAHGNLNLLKQYDNFRKTWDLALMSLPVESIQTNGAL